MGQHINMMSNELISVIVPVYKVEPYLDKCVQSIADQTYQNLEIILVDDGSPDACPDMCDRWAIKDARIKVIHKENGGLSDARNAGLAVATGELISFVDSDDWLEPDFLEELYRALRSNAADVAQCDVLYVDEEGRPIRPRGVAEIPVMDKTEALRRLILEDGVHQTVWNKLYRHTVIEGIPFEKGKYNEDDFWTYLIFDRINRLAVVDRPLYCYLQRRGSIMGAGYRLKRLDGLEARFRRMEYLQKYRGLAALSRERFMLDCMYHMQYALTDLEGEDSRTAVDCIKRFMRKIPNTAGDKSTLSGKYRLWVKAFRRAPKLVARVRNLAGIGR